MPGTKWAGDGNSWERHVILLLNQRHRHSHNLLKQIPAKHKGDLGLEAFSVDGFGYQCYSATEPISDDLLYEKQRDKMTQDVGKFVRNETALLECLGSVQIARWVLVVPRYEDKRIVMHAKSKEEEVRAKSLRHASPDFTVHVQTRENFEIEEQELIAQGLGPMDLNVDPVTVTIRENWTAGNDVLVRKLDHKLAKLGSVVSAKDRSELVQLMVTNFLRAENIATQMQHRFPTAHERYIDCKIAKEEELSMLSLLGNIDAQDGIRSAMQEFRDELRASIPSLPGPVQQHLASGAVSEWLQRCPLDFKPGSGDGT